MSGVRVQGVRAGEQADLIIHIGDDPPITLPQLQGVFEREPVGWDWGRVSYAVCRTAWAIASVIYSDENPPPWVVANLGVLLSIQPREGFTLSTDEIVAALRKREGKVRVRKYLMHRLAVSACKRDG